jgi:hypothetical protein
MFCGRMLSSRDSERSFSVRSSSKCFCSRSRSHLMNLYNRLRGHTKDKPKRKWDQFAIFRVCRVHYLKVCHSRSTPLSPR